MPLNVEGYEILGKDVRMYEQTNIVRAGLVLHLDASIFNTVPLGSTWYDLSGNGHNVTLGSAVTLVSNEGGGILNFPENSNGTGVNTTLNLSSSDNTVMTFSRKNSTGNDGRVVTALNNNWLLGHHDTTYGDYYAEGWINEGVGTSDNIWRMFTGTGNISSDIWQLYINEELITSNNGGSQGPNGLNLNGQFSQYSNCQIAIILAYNRVLSATEIAHNYNVTKGRFGL